MSYIVDHQNCLPEKERHRHTKSVRFNDDGDHCLNTIRRLLDIKPAEYIRLKAYEGMRADLLASAEQAKEAGDEFLYHRLRQDARLVEKLLNDQTENSKPIGRIIRAFL